jgi:hypothetical protein
MFIFFNYSRKTKPWVHLMGCLIKMSGSKTLSV